MPKALFNLTFLRTTTNTSAVTSASASCSKTASFPVSLYGQPQQL